MNATQQEKSAPSAQNTLLFLCEHFNKNNAKARYFLNKLTDLNHYLAKNNPSTDLIALSYTEQQCLVQHELNPNSLLHLPSLRWVTLALCTLLMGVFTLPHLIFLQNIENLYSLFLSYIYSSSLCFFSFIAGLFFRARRTQKKADDFLWSSVALLLMLPAYLSIQLLFFYAEHYPITFSLQNLMHAQQLFKLFFSVPHDLILQAAWAMYLVFALAIFYISSYLFYGSPDIARIVVRHPTLLTGPTQQNTLHEQTQFDSNKATQLLKSYAKFQEKLMTELDFSHLLKDMDWSNHNEASGDFWSNLSEKLDYLNIVHESEQETQNLIKQISAAVTQQAILKQQYDRLKIQLLALNTAAEEQR